MGNGLSVYVPGTPRAPLRRRRRPGRIVVLGQEAAAEPSVGREAAGSRQPSADDELAAAEERDSVLVALPDDFESLKTGISFPDIGVGEWEIISIPDGLFGNASRISALYLADAPTDAPMLSLDRELVRNVYDPMRMLALTRPQNEYENPGLVIEFPLAEPVWLGTRAGRQELAAEFERRYLVQMCNDIIVAVFGLHYQRYIDGRRVYHGNVTKAFFVERGTGSVFFNLHAWLPQEEFGMLNDIRQLSAVLEDLDQGKAARFLTNVINLRRLGIQDDEEGVRNDGEADVTDDRLVSFVAALIKQLE